ncbi:MAG: hypothetical protein Aurels2KO_45430 [Aureliella sp.]
MELLDRKLDELDECWGTASDGAVCLQEIIDDLPDGCEDRDELVIELCCADMEWRWRSGRNCFVGTTRPDDPDATQSHSMLSIYDVYLDQLAGREDHRKRLVLAEWRARSAWGDCPDLSDFVQASGFDDSVCESLQEELDALAGLRVRIEMDDAVLEHQVVGEFELGRQNVQEPTPPSWLADKNRLLVARLEQTEVSRRQLVIRRTRMNEVEIANVSRNVSVAIRNSIITPGDRIRAALPIAFKLQSGKVTLSCNRLDET